MFLSAQVQKTWATKSSSQTDHSQNSRMQGPISSKGPPVDNLVRKGVCKSCRVGIPVRGLKENKEGSECTHGSKKWNNTFHGTLSLAFDLSGLWGSHLRWHAWWSDPYTSLIIWISACQHPLSIITAPFSSLASGWSLACNPSPDKSISQLWNQITQVSNHSNSSTQALRSRPPRLPSPCHATRLPRTARSVESYPGRCTVPFRFAEGRHAGVWYGDWILYVPSLNISTHYQTECEHQVFFLGKDRSGQHQIVFCFVALNKVLIKQ